MSILSYLNEPKLLLIYIAILLLVIFAILPVHEFAHAWAAQKMGDNTARNLGRLTFNPLAHLDIFGAIFLILFGFGWAKPVPVNPRNFKNYKKGTVLVSLAGPLSNVICASLGMLLIKILVYLPIPTDLWLYISLAVDIVDIFVQINISLAVFNLLPIPPLDGFNIFSSILPYKALNFIAKNQRIIYILFIFLLFSGVLGIPLSFLIDLLYNGIYHLFFWVDIVAKLFM